jgi:hypothetical protein
MYCLDCFGYVMCIIHTWKFSFEQGVHIMLFGAKHILGRLVKKMCQFDSLNVNVMNCKIYQWVCNVDGRIQTPNHKFSLGGYVIVCIKDSKYYFQSFVTLQMFTFIGTKWGELYVNYGYIKVACFQTKFIFR